jgi:oxaloacetate decarboxylase alpha subunit
MEKEITHRPADDIPAEYGKLEEEAKKVLGTGTVTTEDVLTYAMFPKVAPNFFKTRADGPVVFKPEDAPAPAAKTAPGQAEKYNVNVNGVDYAVVVSPAGSVAVTAAPIVAATAGSTSSGGASSGGITIPAPVAGTILRYSVAEGAQVQKGATIMIIESMKMELEIKTTESGKIHFMVPAGTQVAAQQPVAQIGGAAGAPAAAPAAAAPAAAAPAASSGAATGGGVTVPAPVAGTILRHAVAEGSQVSPGTTIIIIESMKMELEIKAGSAGKVHFLVPAGTQVASQQPVAEIK